MRKKICLLKSEKERTEKVIRKRTHFRSLVEKVEKVVEQHLKENEGGVGMSMMASPQIVSWNETSYEDITEEENEKRMEFRLGFKFISYT